jgi:hypothetical protein
MQSTTIKDLVKIYYDSQEFRKSAANRLRPYISDGENIEDLLLILENDEVVFNEPFPQTCLTMIKEYTRIEKKISLIISNQITAYPIHEWLIANKGIGPMLAGALIGYIGDISKFDKVTSLWAYAGMGVIEICDTCKKRHIHDGSKGAWIQHTADRLKEQNDKVKDKSKKKKDADFIKDAESKLCHCENPNIRRVSQRKIQGQLLDYNPDFKQLCYLIGDQFIKQRESPYRKLYDQFRLEYENRPDLMKERDSRVGGASKGTGHINDMARRKAVKIFLSHLWEEWRTIEGLPTPEPYSFAILGHTDKIKY